MQSVSTGSSRSCSRTTKSHVYQETGKLISHGVSLLSTNGNCTISHVAAHVSCPKMKLKFGIVMMIDAQVHTNSMSVMGHIV